MLTQHWFPPRHPFPDFGLTRFLATRIKRKLAESVEVKIQEVAELERLRAERKLKMTGEGPEEKDARRRPVLWL